MENNAAENAQSPGTKRRRSRRKSRKLSHQQRKRLRIMGYWLLAGAIGIIVVTAIAVMAGNNAAD